MGSLKKGITRLQSCTWTYSNLWNFCFTYLE